MTKAERLQLPAVRLGATGQHLDMSSLAKANGDVIDGMMSLKDSTDWMEFVLIRHPEGDMSLGLSGKLLLQLIL